MTLPTPPLSSILATPTGTSASPPPEVSDAIAVAARAADRLAQSNRALRFDADGSGRVIVHVTDASGAVLHTISGTQALAIASGAPFH